MVYRYFQCCDFTAWITTKFVRLPQRGGNPLGIGLREWKPLRDFHHCHLSISFGYVDDARAK